MTPAICSLISVWPLWHNSATYIDVYDVPKDPAWNGDVRAGVCVGGRCDRTRGG